MPRKKKWDFTVIGTKESFSICAEEKRGAKKVTKTNHERTELK